MKSNKFLFIFKSWIFIVRQRDVSNEQRGAQIVCSVFDGLFVAAAGRSRQSASTFDCSQKRRQRFQLSKCKYVCTLSEATRIFIRRHFKKTIVYCMQRKRILFKLIYFFSIFVFIMHHE